MSVESSIKHWRPINKRREYSGGEGIALPVFAMSSRCEIGCRRSELFYFAQDIVRRILFDAFKKTLRRKLKAARGLSTHRVRMRLQSRGRQSIGGQKTK